MREYLTTEDICNELSMERTVFDGTFMVVEGITDSRLFGKFAEKDGVRIRIAHSKDNVRGVVKEMAGRRRDRRVIGIVDADLELLRGRIAKPPLFNTDCRDMEMMIIRSNALDDIVDEYGDPEKVRDFEERYGPIRDALVSASYPIGLLMFVSQERGLSLSFKDLNFSRFINPRSMEIDVREMIAEVLDNSRSAKIGRKELVKLLGEEAEALDDLWKAARGHDTIDILLIGLRKSFGSFNASGLDEGALGGSLRLAFSDECFRSTELYQNTEEWADENGLVLWDLHRGPRRPRDPTCSLGVEVLGPDAVGGLHDLLDASLAVVEDGAAVVPQDDGALVDLQTPVQVGAALLQLLDELLELLHAGLEAHLSDLFPVLLHVTHANPPESRGRTSWRCRPSA